MNLLKMPTVKFFLRSNNDKSKSHVLYCRVNYNGSTAEFSIREKIEPNHWNQVSQKVKSNSLAQTKYLNYLIESVTYKIKYLFLDQKFKNATAKQVLSEVFDSEKKEMQIDEIISKYIDSQKSIAPGTRKNHLIKLSNLVKFQDRTNTKYRPSDFHPLDANRFIEWFKEEKSTTKNTSAVRNVLFYKTAMQWALNNGIIECFSLQHYTAKKDVRKSPIFLSRLEIEAIKNVSCSSKFHERVKDLFLFQCLTGLSYCDLWSWKLEDKNGTLYLSGQRNKNGSAFLIPFDSEAKQILEKYNGEIPKYNNIVYNRILKFVAKEAGIKKTLTTHVGRKTFATMQDGKGWTRESVALMLGHKSIRTTESYYIGLSFDRITHELSALHAHQSVQDQLCSPRSQ